MTMATPGTPPAKLSQRMSSQDASFIYGESTSGPLHIGTLNIFDGPIDYDEVVEHMAQRMHLLPRYRQKLLFVPFNLAHATLEDDPNFDLHNHLICHSLPDGTDDKAFVRAAMAAFEPMLDRGKPLWEMHLFQGLKGGRSAIVWKIHHCLVDGVSVSLPCGKGRHDPGPEGAHTWGSGWCRHLGGADRGTLLLGRVHHSLGATDH